MVDEVPDLSAGPSTLSTPMASRTRRPNRSAAPLRPPTHDNTSDTDPTWNTSLAKLAEFLAAFKRNDYLFNAVKDGLSLCTRGYTVDSKNKRVVYNWAHLRHIVKNPTERFTFETPSDPLAFTLDPVAEQKARDEMGVTPSYGPKATADEIKEATDKAKETEKELLSTFSITPMTLEDSTEATGRRNS